MSKFADDLAILRERPQPSRSDEDFVALVLAACDSAGARRPPREARRLWPWATASTALAAAAALLLWPSPSQDPLSRPGGSVAARGQGLTVSGPTVQAFVGRSGHDGLPDLLEGATLRPGDGIAVRYSNPTTRAAFLTMFALDGHGDVHWLHPAYLNEADDPRSLKLEPQTSLRLLDEVAEPESPAPGPLRVYALVSDVPLSVKRVEARLRAGAAPVHQLFSEAEVEEWRCTWSAP